MDPRRNQMQDDWRKYGSEPQEGEYRGVKWSARLVTHPAYSPRNDPRNNTDNQRSFWCGYIHLGRPATQHDQDCIVGDCSYDNGDTIGFDCAHCDDYPMGVTRNATYKDLEHVKRILFRSIDRILDGFDPSANDGLDQ